MNLAVNVNSISQERHQLLCKIAWLYYHDELTQAEIAERLGTSRVTVNRWIREARDRGIVEIKVITDRAQELDLGQQLCQRFQLKDALVTPPVSSELDLQKSLGQGAATILMQRILDDMTIGVGVGRTVSQIPDYFNPKTPISCRFIGLTGALDLRLPGVPHTFDTVSKLATACQGEAVFIPAPSYVTYESVRNALLSEAAVRDALNIAAQSDIAVFSLGVADYSALLYQFGQITDEDLEQMKQSNTAGDIIGHFFNTEGTPLNISLNERVIGISFTDLLNIQVRILVAGGKLKRDALSVALKNHFCNILVTDMASATALLE